MCIKYIICNAIKGGALAHTPTRLHVLVAPNHYIHAHGKRVSRQPLRVVDAALWEAHVGCVAYVCGHACSRHTESHAHATCDNWDSAVHPRHPIVRGVEIAHCM